MIVADGARVRRQRARLRYNSVTAPGDTVACVARGRAFIFYERCYGNPGFFVGLDSFRASLSIFLMMSGSISISIVLRTLLPLST